MLGAALAFTGCGSDPQPKAITFDRSRYEMAVGIDAASSVRVTADVIAEGADLPDAKVSYSVADPAVAAVDESGLLTAKKAGTTTVTAECGGVRRSAPVVVYAQATAEQVNGLGEAYVNTYGRNGVKDGVVWCEHVASGAEVTFYGTELTATVALTGKSYARVFVDGEAEGTFKELSSAQDFVLAEELPLAIHTVRLLKSSETDDGIFTIGGFGTDGQFLTAAPKADYKIEFVGDSITSGYGALGKYGDARTVANSDVCKGYAYLTAQKLEADFTFVALQGICVNKNIYQPELRMSDMYRWVSPSDKADYSFDDGVNMVVLNLGTNDNSYITSVDGSYADEFTNDYEALLRYIREKRPNAKIICAYGNMGTTVAIENGIKSAIQRIGDANIEYLLLRPDSSGAVGHPSAAANQTLSDMFAKELKKRK